MQLGFLLAYFVLAGAGNAVQLAFLAVACSPGGGKSSFWTIIFNGNLDLSVCMTFMETVGAAGESHFSHDLTRTSSVMTPLWLYTAGRVFFDRHVTVPLVNFAQSLGVVLVPTTLGMLAVQFRPDMVASIRRWIKVGAADLPAGSHRARKAFLTPTHNNTTLFTPHLNLTKFREKPGRILVEHSINHDRISVATISHARLNQKR